MKWIKTYEGLFGFDLVKLLKPVYKMIEKEEDTLDIKNELINSLDEYKGYLIDFSQNRLGKETQIEDDIKKLESELDSTISRELNISLFLRTISNILYVPKRRGDVKIDKKFEEYYNTLSQRIDRCIDVIKTGKPSGYEGDEADEDTSVLDRKEFKTEITDLQVEMNKLMEDVAKNKRKVAILMDGRDGAGKGSTIKAFTQYMNPKYYRVVTMGIPTKEDMEGENWFNMYKAKMPKEGEIVFFDRSYYNMAINNPVFGYCTEEQYTYFMEHVNQFEANLISEGVELYKYWFSITKEKQLERFDLRIKSPLKYWKFSPNDAKASEKWDVFTKYKEQCFKRCSTARAPFIVVQSGDKKLAKLNSLRYILDKSKYEGKDSDKIGKPYPDVVYELK